MVKAETSFGGAGNAWLDALRENEAEDSIYPGVQDSVPEENHATKDVEADGPIYPGVDEAVLGGVGQEAAPEDDTNTAGFDALSEANAAGIEARKQEVLNNKSLEALREANEEYDASTMDSLEAAERDVKESFWKKAGGAMTKIYRKLVGLATGKKVETAAESAEATKEIAGKIGSAVLKTGEKVLTTATTTAVKTVMSSMGYGG